MGIKVLRALSVYLPGASLPGESEFGLDEIESGVVQADFEWEKIAQL
jgi:hypothetical protein